MELNLSFKTKESKIIELTLEEAKELYTELKNIFGNSYSLAYPRVAYPETNSTSGFCPDHYVPEYLSREAK